MDVKSKLTRPIVQPVMRDMKVDISIPSQK
jgi:hypothetical protein